jgi:DNA polymerase-3 subunit epsilon
VRFYLGRDYEGGHSAATDVLATAEVLDAMLARYADLPRSVADLHQHLKDPNAVDSSGCFTGVEGQIRFAFGKYRGQPLDVVASEQPGYLQWLLDQDFFEDTKAVIRRALGQRSKCVCAP